MLPPFDPIHTAPRRALSLLAMTLSFAVLLVACDGGNRADPGLIAAPGFSDDAGRLARPWQFAHHASNESYVLSVTDGAVAIERVGHEPWARLAQNIRPEALPEVAGRRMAFSADLRASLSDREHGKPIEPTGLMVRIWRRAGDGSMINALIGSPRPRIERLALDANARIEDWRRHAIEFELPEDVSRLEVSAVLSTGGRLEIRNPSLRVID